MMVTTLLHLAGGADVGSPLQSAVEWASTAATCRPDEGSGGEGLSVEKVPGMGGLVTR